MNMYKKPLSQLNNPVLTYIARIKLLQIAYTN